MCKWMKSLVGDERPATERALILAIAALSGLAAGMLLSPLSKNVVDSYNGSYYEGGCADGTDEA